MDNTVFNGCDLSSAQGILTTDNFSEMSKQYSFALLECHVGNDYKSSVYEANKSGCINAAMKVLPYHFLYPLPNAIRHSNRNPADQATLHYASCNSVAVADLEWPEKPNWPMWLIPNAAFIEDWVNTYMQRYKDLSGTFPILYSYPYYMSCINNPISFKQYKLWLASYQDTPDLPAPWSQSDMVLWQYSSHGKLPNGAPVDLDRCYDITIFD